MAGEAILGQDRPDLAVEVDQPGRLCVRTLGPQLIAGLCLAAGMALTSRTHPSTIIPVGLLMGFLIRLIDPAPVHRVTEDLGGLAGVGELSAGRPSRRELDFMSSILTRRGHVTQGLNLGRTEIRLMGPTAPIVKIQRISGLFECPMSPCICHKSQFRND